MVFTGVGSCPTNASKECMLCRCARLGRVLAPRKFDAVRRLHYFPSDSPLLSANHLRRLLVTQSSKHHSCNAAFKLPYSRELIGARRVSTSAAADFLTSLPSLKDYDAQQIQACTKFMAA